MPSILGWFGPIPLSGSAKQIAVVPNIDGRLEILFIGTDSLLHHSFQLQVNGLFWSLAEALTTIKVAQMAAITNQDGRLEVFYTDNKGNLFHNWQQQPANSENPPSLKLGWAGQQQLKGITAKQLAVAMNGDTRLELFFTDGHNNLSHMWQTAVPDFHMPATLNMWSGQVLFGSGATAKAIAAATNVDGRIEVFYIGSDNMLFHNWQQVPATNPINPPPVIPWFGQTRFGKNVKANQVTVGVNADQRLEAFYVGTNGYLFHSWQTKVPISPYVPESPSLWSPQSRIPKASAKQVSVVTDPEGRLNVFYVGLGNKVHMNNQSTEPSLDGPSTLNSWATDSSFPRNAKQVVAACNADGRLEFFCVDTDNKLSHFWQTLDLGRTASRSNHLAVSASGNFENLLNVFVVIDITQDLVVEASTGSTKGFSIQLNAFSPTGSKTVWQQYGIQLFGSQLAGFANNWDGKSRSVINSHFNLMKFPNSTIPTGTQLQISLGNDTSGNVSEIGCAVFQQPSGTRLADVTKKLKSFPGGSAKNLAPIIAFEVDIVGPDNSAGTIFSSGAGTIRYQADNGLSSTDNVPANVAHYSATEEIANTSYGLLQPVALGSTLEQTFNFSTTGDA